MQPVKRGGAIIRKIMFMENKKKRDPLWPMSLSQPHIRAQSKDGDKLRESVARYTVPIRPGRQDQRDLKTKGFPGFVYRVAA